MSAESTSAAEISLAADFTTLSLIDWEKEVLKVLNRGRPRGKELNIEQVYERLTSRAVDGLVIRPLYTTDGGTKELGFPRVAPFTRSTTARAGGMGEGRFSTQLIGEPSPAETRRVVDTSLERGTSAVWVRMNLGAVPAGKLAEVLSDALFDLTPTHVSSNTDELAVAEALAAAFAASGKKNIRGSFSIDPIGLIVLNRTTPSLSVIARAVKPAKPFSGIHPVVVDASHYNSMGAGDVVQLACALAMGIEYVRVPADLGLNADEAFGSILFRVSANTNQLIIVSRLRTLRTLWSQVDEVLGISPEKHGAVQHVVTSLCEITRDGACVNVLRGTISAFAATVGQVEFITVLSLDTVIGLPDVLTRRIARNTQAVLAEESSIDRVNDPADGT